MDDREALDSFLRSLDPERLQDVVSAVETFESDFTTDQVVPSVTVLLNLMPELPERKRGMFDLDTRMVVGRVTYRLLRALPDEGSVEAAAREILPESTTLSAKLELVSDVGHRDGRGHKLVSEDAAADLEREWRAEVRAASIDDLIREPELLRTLYLALKESEAGEDTLDIADDPRLTAAILKSAKSEARSQSMGSRAVRRSSRLAWDVLVELFGSENELVRRVDELKAPDIETAEGLIDLFEKYREGWRPDRFDAD